MTRNGRNGSTPFRGTFRKKRHEFCVALFYYFHFMSPFEKIIRDPAFWALAVINVFFIYEYHGDPKQYTTIIWLYWCQSVLLGTFNFFDMLTLKTVKADSMTINGKPATPGQAKGCLPVFFLFHYGIFHLVYFVFLAVDLKFSNVDFTFLKWAIFGILFNQIIHFVQNKTKYADVPRSIGVMFITPYLRIVPMHLTILLPKFIGMTPAITFLVLKTVFDLISHIATTRYYWNKEEKPEEGFI